MKHSLYQTGDARAPDALLDRNGEVALALCKVCGGAEGSLPTDCPGFKLSYDTLESIYSGKIDFINKTWGLKEGAT